MDVKPPKLLAARQRVSAALMQANIQQNKPQPAATVPDVKKKKKGAVAALLAATGQF